MTTITLEIPDELAAHFQVDAVALPALIREALANKFTKLAAVESCAASAPPVYQEIVDFLSASPTPEQLIGFKLSTAAQARLEDLLYKHREAELTLEEQTELETYRQLNHVIIRLKARALSSPPFVQALTADN